MMMILFSSDNMRLVVVFYERIGFGVFSISLAAVLLKKRRGSTMKIS